jgi:hypothetical protein
MGLLHAAGLKRRRPQLTVGHAFFELLRNLST